jgi:hypothetical protein
LNEKLRTWIAIILSLILIGIWFLLIYYGLWEVMKDENEKNKRNIFTIK